MRSCPRALCHHESMTAPSPIEVVDAAVSAASSLDGSTVWCAAFPMVAAQHPRLPQSHDEHQTPPFGCVDLWVQVDGGGKLEFFWVEGTTLGQTLAALGRPDEAFEADGLVGSDAVEVADRLAALVMDMLSSSTADLDGHPERGGVYGG